jgi:hypothetical protein
MNCKKIKKWLPLYIENDLPTKKTSRIKSHLTECPLCQQEYQKYKNSLSKTNKWIQSETLEWEEQEWRDTLERAFSHKKPKDKIFIPLSFKPAWTLALMLVMAAVLSIFVVNPSIMKKERSAAAASDINLVDTQQQVEFTLVSLEKNIKIKWIFNKDFNLKEEIK